MKIQCKLERRMLYFEGNENTELIFNFPTYLGTLVSLKRTTVLPPEDLYTNTCTCYVLVIASYTLSF